MRRMKHFITRSSTFATKDEERMTVWTTVCFQQTRYSPDLSLNEKIRGGAFVMDCASRKRSIGKPTIMIDLDLNGIRRAEKKPIAD
jgi:hypothetical protein